MPYMNILLFSCEAKEIQSFFKTKCSVSGLEKVAVHIQGGHYLTFYIEYDELLELWSKYQKMILNGHGPVFNKENKLVPLHEVHD